MDIQRLQYLFTNWCMHLHINKPVHTFIDLWINKQISVETKTGFHDSAFPFSNTAATIIPQYKELIIISENSF